MNLTLCFPSHSYVSKLNVEKQLKQLKRRKASGYDNIPPGLLKDAATVLSGPLAFIINLSMRTGTVPTDWKLAKVVPLHKGGTHEISNYRPISILPVLSKVMERCVHNQLISYLDSNKILSSKQFGYRKNRSTEIATLLLTNEIRKEVDKGKW